MKNALLHHISSTLTSIGINILQDKTAKYKIWKSVVLYMLLVCVDISLLMVSFTNRDDFNKFVTPAPYIAAASVLLSGLHITYRKRSSIRHLLQLLDTNLYDYPDEQLVPINYEWYLRSNNIFKLMDFLFSGQIFFFLMIGLPALGELVYYQRIHTFIYPTWTPWKMGNVKTELFTYLIEVSQAFCGLYFNQIVICFELVVIVELVKQYLRLEVAIRSLEYRTLEFSSRKNLKEKEHDRVMRENIMHCIRHYQIIHKSYRLFKNWFDAFFSLELAICLTTFAFALYVTMNATNLPQIWNFFTALAFIWCSFLTRCLVSEIFNHLNDRLGCTIFWEIEWLRLSSKNRRLIVMFHQNISSRFPGLFGLSIMEANRIYSLIKFERKTLSLTNHEKQITRSRLLITHQYRNKYSREYCS